MQLFIYSQGFTGIYDFTMLRIKNVPHMIKDHNLVPNKEAHLGAIQQRKLQVLMWWESYCHCRGLVITAATWNAE